MLLAIVLLFFISESAVKCQTALLPSHNTPLNAVTKEAAVTAPPSTFAETLYPVVVAKPPYPFVAGPTVDLRCTALATPASVIWSWQRLEDLAWREVGRGNNLTLTEPGQSGLYRCSADTALSHSVSHNTTVFILAMQPTVTVGEKLGIAALVLSLLAMTVALTILFLLIWPRFGDTLTASDSAAKASPGPAKAPKGCSPQADADVYMNYTGTNEAYSDLDPSNMTGDDLYSSLS